MHVNVPSVETQKLVGKGGKNGEDSRVIQKRVQAARDAQTERFKNTKVKSNSEMSTRNVKKYCLLSPQCRTMLMSAAASMSLSARSYFKIIKISRTIADLAGVEKISTNHLAEALQYRPKDTEF